MQELNLPSQELPNNIFAERYILGSILVNTDAIIIVNQRLKVEAFYLQSHQILYQGTLRLQSENKKIDYITLTTWLQDNHYKEYVNEIAKIASFFNQVFGINNLEDYVALVYEKYLRRRLIEFGLKIITRSHLNHFSVEDLFSTVQQEVFLLSENKKEKKFNSAAEILGLVVKDIKQSIQSSGSSNLTTSFHELDAITQGFQKSDLIILAGRPSTGKTALSLHLAKDICEKHKVSVLFFSLEMSQQQLMFRLLSTQTKIDNAQLRSGLLSKNDWYKIRKAVKHLSQLRLFIDDTANLKVDQIGEKIRQLEREYQEKFSIVVIDYLQLIEGSIKTDKTENRAQEVSKITRKLKILARSLNLPILVLSQLSRSVETRAGHRPILSDLRESGCFGLMSPHRKVFNQLRDLRLLTTLTWTGKKLMLKNIDKTIITGQKPIYQLNTNLGWNILITGAHNIYTKAGWKKTRLLTKNDFIFIKLLLFFCNLNKKSFLNLGQVVGLSYLKVTCVYDFTISLFSNFLSNRLILHNSIEQDADVVMMLYQDTSPNNKEKDVIEIILSKHRHGALGTAKLKFDSKYLCFRNIIEK